MWYPVTTTKPCICLPSPSAVSLVNAMVVVLLFVSALVFQVPCVCPACIVSALVIGLSSCGWLMEASKGDPLVLSVWDGTTMVGCSAHVRVDVSGSSEIVF